jgi:hypothetical protein
MNGHAGSRRLPAPRATAGEWIVPAGLGGLLAALAGLGSARSALLILAVLGATAVLAAVAVFARERLVDFLFLAVIAFVSLPVDKYFLYEPHVGGWPGLRVSLADVFLILLVPLALLGGAIGRTRWAVPRSATIFGALLLVQYVVSAVGAPRRGLALFEIASTVHAYLVAMILASLFHRGHVRAVAALSAAAVVLHTGFALVQVATGRPVGRDWLAGEQEVMRESLTTGLVRIRPSGLFDDPITYADFLLVTLPLLVAAFASARSARARLGLLAALVAGFSGLALTLSRGAWVSTAAALVVLLGIAVHDRLVRRGEAARILTAALFIGIPLALVLGPGVYQRLTASQAGNLEVRFELNRIAWSMVTANPLTGVGLNNFLEVMERYDPRDVMAYFPATVHNLYLLEAAEAGFPGLVLFVGFWVVLVGSSLRRLERLKDREVRWLAAALMASIVGFGVSQLADFSHRLEPMRSILWAEVGLLLGALRMRTPRSRSGVA